MASPERTIETRSVRRYYDESADRYDGWLRSFDRVMLGDRRRTLCGRARGRTLEVAVGTGANLVHYPPGVELTGVDLSAGMLALARRRAEHLHIEADFEVGDVEHLAIPDASYETVVATLLLSTVPHPRRAVAEMSRVIKPGGTLLLLDMTRSPVAPVRWMERLLDPVTTKYSRFSLLRDPLDHLDASGFVIEELDRARGGIIEQVVARKS